MPWVYITLQEALKDHKVSALGVHHPPGDPQLPQGKIPITYHHLKRYQRSHVEQPLCNTVFPTVSYQNLLMGTKIDYSARQPEQECIPVGCVPAAH